ncbi:hypothetical protein AN639_11235 [Candidatus Epulonipiscium fishelsonii]|uniref:Uncharacterized protein n=1 Tax=Candidatus Epulonipiscium fishelsonii TaxID=77094 RepID=A0ACC8X9H2_9FIRM|nr:hypothetical protein AN396_10315 [Epulopiscium sp. SCG-B11WGA-EpuloA1]ONI43163.1 hypothetical protein AN639_11235 [Epulopiscium sp. SCG-B05WGA-EpuloA1]
MKVKFNWIDGIIILIIIGVLGIGIHLLNRENVSFSKPKVPYNFLAEIANVDMDLLKPIKSGDEIYLTVDNVDKAIIKDVKIEPVKTIIFDADTSVYKEVDMPHKYNGFVTIEVMAHEDTANIMVGSTPIKVGKGIFVKGPGYSSKAHILDMKSGIAEDTLYIVEEISVPEESDVTKESPTN